MINKPVSRQSDILTQDLENELLIYDLQINKAYCLNQTSAMVFQLSDGVRTVSEISELMSRKLGILFSEEFVWLALQDLEKENLLRKSEEMTDYLVSLSRREMVKKAGLASMAALPIIASVIAPSAVAAQSNSSVRCLVPGDCPSGNCASTFFLPVGMFCCPAGNGGAQPGPIGTAAGLECFASCSDAGTNVCCSGSAMSVSSGCDPFCASIQQFCCSCA